jgi:hypothetical protein
LRDEGSVTKLCRCVCCKGALEPAQQLRYLVEMDNLDNPAHLARIRALPSANGKPLPVCKACQAAIEAARRSPAKLPPKAPRQLPPELLGVLGVLSVGVLAALFVSRT